MNYTCYPPPGLLKLFPQQPRKVLQHLLRLRPALAVQHALQRPERGGQVLLKGFGLKPLGALSALTLAMSAQKRPIRSYMRPPRRPFRSRIQATEAEMLCATGPAASEHLFAALLDKFMGTCRPRGRLTPVSDPKPGNCICVCMCSPSITQSNRSQTGPYTCGLGG